MSSTAFCAVIYPEARLRTLVLIAGLVVIVLGAVAVSLATVPAWAKWPALCVWLLVSCYEVVSRRRGWRSCGGIRLLGNGEIAVLGRDGTWAPARLQDGSVLLRGYGWLRLETDNGTSICELVRGRCREDREWRRLHVIWRHV